MTTEYIISEELANKVCAILVNYGENSFANKLCSRPAPSSPTYCLKCTYPEGVCAEEDFCKGCENFDAFFNSCKLTFYKQRFGEKTETIHPRTNASRWLLAVVGCASDTRKQIDAATIRKDEREKAFNKFKEKIQNRIDGIFDAYKEETNPAVSARAYTMADGLGEAINIIESLRHEGVP